MKRLFRVMGWLFVASGVTFLTALAVHLTLPPSPAAADAEQYVALSAYIEQGLTGYSHDLGSRGGLVVIAASTTFSRPMTNSNKIKQYTSLVVSTRHAKAVIHQLNRPLMFEFWVTNLRDVTLKPKFRLPVRYELATENEMNLYPYARTRDSLDVFRTAMAR